MQSLALTVCRFSISAWVGAAALFVVTSIAEQSGPNFDSVVRDHLAAMRFPYYYAFGFSLVGFSLASGFLAVRHPAVGRPAARTFLLCTVLALLLMIADYVWIYGPLVEMIEPAGRARAADFVTYHNASKYINEIDVTLCLIAAIAICLPCKPPHQSPNAVA